MSTIFVAVCDLLLVEKDGGPPQLVQDILKHTEQWNANGYSSEGSARFVIPFRIDNKYYSTDVQLRVLDHEAWMLLEEEDLASAEAFVFLGRKATSQSLALLETAIAKHGVSNVNVCVVVSDGSEPQLDPNAATIFDAGLQSKLEAFCIESGVEFIDADEIDDSEADFGRQHTAVHRVLDSLWSHMWPNMTMKSKQEQLRQPQSGTMPLLPPSPQQRQLEEPLPTSGVQDASFNDLLASMNNLGSLDDDEDAFDNAIAMAQSMRTRLQGLPDDQRRAAAAQLVLSLMQQFGGSDDDDEDGGDIGADLDADLDIDDALD